MNDELKLRIKGQSATPINLRLCRDKNGVFRAEVAHPFEALEHFLESDLQGGTEASQHFLDPISDVQKGNISHWEGTGNTTTLALTPTKAHLYNEFAIPTLECELPLPKFHSVVEGWLEFVTS